MIFLDPDDRVFQPKSNRKSTTTGKASPDTHVCLYDPAEEDKSTFISKAAAAELYLAMSAYSSAAVRNTRTDRSRQQKK